MVPYLVSVFWDYLQRRNIYLGQLVYCIDKWSSWGKSLDHYVDMHEVPCFQNSNMAVRLLIDKANELNADKASTNKQDSRKKRIINPVSLEDRPIKK